MLTILTVNSSVSTRDKTIFTLKGAGYHVIEASDGDDALYKAKWINPDAVLMDCNLKKMDGITLIQKLREISAYQQMPMLMLTTKSIDKDINHLEHEGLTNFLTKPFKADQLLATIKKLLPEEKTIINNKIINSNTELTH